MQVNEGSSWSLEGGGIDNDRYPYRKLIGSGLRDFPERYKYSYLILEKKKRFKSLNYPILIPGISHLVGAGRGSELGNVLTDPDTDKLDKQIQGWTRKIQGELK